MGRMLRVIVLLLTCVILPAADDSPIKSTYVYKTAGGFPIRADVYRSGTDEVQPAILWVHGGALIFGSRENLNREQMKRYVGAGYTVVAIDYRLAPENLLPAILTDLDDAWTWVRAKSVQLGIDPKRIAVVGHSAGGYLTLTSGFRLKPRPTALVSFYGYGEIATDWYSKPDPFYLSQPAISKEEARKAIEEPGANRVPFYYFCRQHGLWPKAVAGLDPATQMAAFKPFCPLRNVTRNYPPTLLLHGDRDEDVPYQQSVDMAAELKRQRVEHEFLTIPNGPHGFDGRKGMQDPAVATAFDRVIAFLDAHLKKR
jgi:acetyl esterase/lipase